MAQDSAVARRYAGALFEAASEARLQAEVGSDLKRVVEAIWADDELRRFFLDNRAPARAKKELVKELGGASVQPLARNLLCLAVDKRREDYAMDILKAYSALVDRAAGVVDVEVRTAVALDGDGAERLRADLAQRLGTKVRVKFVVDRSIIGGLVIKIDDRLFDASIKRRLTRLGEHLAKARVGV